MNITFLGHHIFTMPTTAALRQHLFFFSLRVEDILILSTHIPYILYMINLLLLSGENSIVVSLLYSSSQCCF